MAAFLAGLAAIEVATQGIVGQYDGILFSDHMVQHLLLMMVAAPLLVMGAPVTPRPAGSPTPVPGARPPAAAPRPGGAVPRPPGGELAALRGRAVGQPLLADLRAVARERTVHDLEHLVFLVAALLFWWPMLGSDPVPWRIPHPARLMLLLLQMVQGSFLGVAILNAPRPLYAHYAGLQLGYITPLADQQVAGAIMWVFGGLHLLRAALIVLYEWMQAEDAATVRVDARLDRGGAPRSRRSSQACRSRPGPGRLSNGRRPAGMR